jgi:hypothetical protein
MTDFEDPIMLCRASCTLDPLLKVAFSLPVRITKVDILNKVGGSKMIGVHRRIRRLFFSGESLEMSPPDLRRNAGSKPPTP